MAIFTMRKFQGLAVINHHMILLSGRTLLLSARFRFNHIYALRAHKDMVDIPFFVCRKIMKDTEAIQHQLIEFLPDGAFSHQPQSIVGRLGYQFEKRIESKAITATQQ